MKSGPYKPRKPKQPDVKVYRETIFTPLNSESTISYKRLQNAMKKFAKTANTDVANVKLNVKHFALVCLYERKPTEEELENYKLKMEKYQEQMAAFKSEISKQVTNKYKKQAQMEIDSLDKKIAELAEKVKLNVEK